MDGRLEGGVPGVPGYELGELLGRGSTGRVWSATRLQDRLPVAVKVVELIGDDDADRVARELSVLACTAVDGLVGFHESVGLATDPPAVAIVLDRVDGGSLAGAVGARGHLSVGEAVTVLAPVARALAGLHAAGVVHGDVSPGNVLLERTGRPLLADVGVARLVGDRPGELFGTEGFVAPEVADGAVPTCASDVYAVGALAWWCVTGAPPGPAALRPSLAELEPGLPAAFLEWTRQAMSSDPGERPDAAVLALGYFDSAPCVPLHLVVGSDETSLLTQRLRQSADAVKSRPTGRVDGGVRSRPRVVGGVLAMVTMLGLGLGLAVAAGGPSWPDIAVAQPGPRTPAEPSRPAHRTTTEGTPTSGDAATDRGAPGRDPRALMQALADQRARVMGSRPEQAEQALAALDVHGSPAMTADLAAVRALATSGERYRDVRLSVRSARMVSPPGDTVRVEAVVDTAAHVMVDGSGSATPRGAVAGTPMVFTLRWGDGRWRIASVQATAAG